MKDVKDCTFTYKPVAPDLLRCLDAGQQNESRSVTETPHPQTTTSTNTTSNTTTSTTAWAFAGQGSQVVGMGRDLYEAFPQVRPIFDSPAAGFDLKALCFEGPAHKLADTRYTQACMAAFAAAVVRVLQDAGHAPAAALGLSLGEYSALHAAGVFTADTLLALLGYRGAIMADASTQPSRMTAVFGLADEQVESIVAATASSTKKVVSCTNYNCPGQVVIGGDQAAVLAAEQALKAAGAKRCIQLNTSGPFHTALMQPAGQLLEARLATTRLAPQQLPVIFNTTGWAADNSQIPALLVKQISSPVRFAQSVRALEAAGITRIVEIGPGKVLAGLIKKTAPSIQTISLETAKDLTSFMEDG